MKYRLIDKKLKYFIHRNLKKINYLYFEDFYKKKDTRFFGSNSQLSQDFLCAIVSEFKTNGTFIEFGATNGIDLSNTYSLKKYLKWKGILVEPVYSYYESLKKNRPESICCNKLVYSESNHEKTFYENNDLSISSLKKTKNAKPIKVKTITLNDIFKINNINYVDYLSIDTEGSEYLILKSFDFEKYSFNFLTVEHNYNFFKRRKIYQLLKSKGYKRIHQNFSFWDDFYTKKTLD
jgi:FkbM family methyltransferase